MFVGLNFARKDNHRAQNPFFAKSLVLPCFTIVELAVVGNMDRR